MMVDSNNVIRAEMKIFLLLVLLSISGNVIGNESEEEFVGDQREIWLPVFASALTGVITLESPTATGWVSLLGLVNCCPVKTKRGEFYRNGQLAFAIYHLAVLPELDLTKPERASHSIIGVWLIYAVGFLYKEKSKQFDLLGKTASLTFSPDRIHYTLYF